MAHLKETMFIDAPVEKLDRIVGDPRQFSNFWEGASEPSKVEGDGGPGTVFEFTQLMMGVPLHETQRTVEERHDPDGSTHWRWEFEGTSSGWVTCDHVPKDEGAEITTEFDYTVPGSVVGKMADRLFIERREARGFHHSLENLKHLAETSD
jgi:hypothetical protein